MAPEGMFWISSTNFNKSFTHSISHYTFSQRIACLVHFYNLCRKNLKNTFTSTCAVHLRCSSFSFVSRNITCLKRRPVHLQLGHLFSSQKSWHCLVLKAGRVFLGGDGVVSNKDSHKLYLTPWEDVRSTTFLVHPPPLHFHMQRNWPRHQLCVGGWGS